MTAPAPASGHSLRVLYDPSAAVVRLSLACHETGRAACRLVCSQDCETWDEHNHEHELIEADECNAVFWIGQDAEEYCKTESDTPFPLHDGMPVEVAWDSDTYVWTPVTTKPLGENFIEDYYDPSLVSPAG